MPKAKAAAVGSLMIRATSKPAIFPASSRSETLSESCLTVDQNSRVTWVQHRRLGHIFGWLRWLPSWYSHDSYENCWKQEGLLKAFKMDRANWNLKWFPSSYQPCGLKRWLFKVQKVSIHPGRRFSHDNETKTTSWWFQPICKILVQWDHFPR